MLFGLYRILASFLCPPLTEITSPLLSPRNGIGRGGSAGGHGGRGGGGLGLGLGG